MNKSYQGAIVLITSMVLTSALTYILTRAVYEKKPEKAKVGIEPAQKPEEKPMKTISNKKGEILLQAEEKDDVIKYAEKYKVQHAALVREYNPDPDDVEEIEFIDADTFDTLDDYETIEFTLYADDILCDEQNKIVIDPENNVGLEAIEKFDDHANGEGCVYIRNHKIQTDFIVVRDLRTYAEAIGGHRNGSD